MKVGITGFNGFIGKNLSNFLSFFSEHAVKHIDVDLTSSIVRDLLHLYSKKIDVVVHLAGKNRGTDEEIIRNNVRGTINLLDFCLKHKIPVIVAGANYHKYDAYKTSKDTVDSLCFSYSYLGLDVAVLNIPKVFGPGCRPFYNSFVTTLIHAAACGHLGEQVKLIDDLDKEIELIHVEDLCYQIEMKLDCVSKGYSSVSFDEDEGLIKIRFKDLVDILNGNRKHKYSEIFLDTVEHYRNEICKA